jgi:hypothetical protein
VAQDQHRESAFSKSAPSPYGSGLISTAVLGGKRHLLPHAVGIFAFRMVVKRSVLERAGIPLMEIGQFEKHRLQDALSKRFETLLGRVTAGG